MRFSILYAIPLALLSFAQIATAGPLINETYTGLVEVSNGQWIPIEQPSTGLEYVTSTLQDPHTTSSFIHTRFTIFQRHLTISQKTRRRIPRLHPNQHLHGQLLHLAESRRRLRRILGKRAAASHAVFVG